MGIESSMQQGNIVENLLQYTLISFSLLLLLFFQLFRRKGGCQVCVQVSFKLYKLFPSRYVIYFDQAAGCQTTDTGHDTDPHSSA